MQNNTTGAPASSLRTGWEPLPSAVWQEVAPLLPQPWTPGQAAHDLHLRAHELLREEHRPGRARVSGEISARGAEWRGADTRAKLTCDALSPSHGAQRTWTP